jgi:hypothetical protein
MANVEQAVEAGHVSRGWLLTHDLPIPESHERVVEMGMETGADFLLLLEEDMVPPSDALVALLKLKTPVACVDYPVGYPKGWTVPKRADSGDGGAKSPGCWPCVPRPNKDGILEWAPFGCTLISRRVFEALPRPWFTTGQQTVTWHFGDVKTVKEVVKEAWKYGGLDIEFGERLQAAGIRIAKVPDMLAGHALLTTWGPLGDNNGSHEIVVRDRIEWEWPR